MKTFISIVCTCLCLSPLVVGQDPVPDPKAVVVHGHARFTILSDSLVRIEASNTTQTGSVQFDDRATLAMVNRKTSVPRFSVTNVNSTAIRIHLDSMEIIHNAKYEPPSAQCQDQSAWMNGTDQNGGSRSPSFPNGTTVNSAGDCCKVCAQDQHCKAWIFATDSKSPAVNCYAMSDISGTKQRDNRILGRSSGSILTPNNFVIRTAGGAVWAPGTQDTENLNGTARSDFNCKNQLDIQDCIDSLWARLTPGLISRSGWTMVDDSATPRFETEGGSQSGWHEETYVDETDWYFAAYDSSLTGEQVPAYRRSLSSFAEVSGRPAMPTRGALLPAYSHYYPYGENLIGNQTLAEYKERGLPLGVLVSDLFWHEVAVPKPCQGYGGYVWNQTLWPDPNGYLEKLHGGQSAYGAPLEFTVNVHPQEGVDVCQGESYYQIGKAVGFDTSTNATIPCDVANETFSDALYEYVTSSSSHANIDFMWTDYGGCGHSTDLPSSYFLLWNNIDFARRNTQQFDGTRRPMVLSRYGGLGDQRRPIGFSGDTHQCYEVLQWQVGATPMASNALFPYWSSDVGGFKPSGVGPGCTGSWQGGNTTQGELYLRWLQFAAFNPVFRTHCTMCIGRDTFAPCTYCERHIWKWPDLYGAMRDAFVVRGMLVPFLYSESFRTFATGTGTFHSMYVDYPNATEAYEYALSQYMMGTSVIVAPAVQPLKEGKTTTSVEVWLPEEQSEWVAFDGSTTQAGGSVVQVDAGLDSVPAFARGGTLLPLQSHDSAMDGANASSPTVLMWTVWLHSSRSPTQAGFELFEDDGVSTEYQSVTDGAASNVSTVTTASATVSKAEVVVDVIGTEGTFPGAPSERRHWYAVRGFGQSSGGKAPSLVTVDGKSVPSIDGTGSADFGYYVVDGAMAVNATLSNPTGTLVVRAGGPVPVTAMHSMVVLL